MSRKHKNERNGQKIREMPCKKHNRPDSYIAGSTGLVSYS